MSLNLFICKIVANPASAWFQLGAHSAGFSAEGWFIFSNLPPFLQLVAEIKTRNGENKSRNGVWMIYLHPETWMLLEPMKLEEGTLLITELESN